MCSFKPPSTADPQAGREAPFHLTLQPPHKPPGFRLGPFTADFKLQLNIEQKTQLITGFRLSITSPLNPQLCFPQETPLDTHQLGQLSLKQLIGEIIKGGAGICQQIPEGRLPSPSTQDMPAGMGWKEKVMGKGEGRGELAEGKSQIKHEEGTR